MVLLASFLLAACGGDGVQVTGPAEVPEPATISQVGVTPHEVSVMQDSMGEVTLEVRASDRTRLDRPGRWQRRGASVVDLAASIAERAVQALAAGSNKGDWSDSGSGLTSLQAGFTSPRSDADDGSFFCVTAVNLAGESEPRCEGFTVPALSSTSSDGSTTDTTVTSVTVSPSSATVEVGYSVQLSGTATNASGDTISTLLSWSSTNSSVATVDAASGKVTGQAQGTAGIVATADNGVADTATVDVTSSSTSSSGPAVVFDPDKYSSTQELQDDPYNVFSDTELGGNYSLDTSVGYPGGSKSMRYDWVDQDCQAISIGRGIPIPGRGTGGSTAQAVTELWVELWVRWSTNFQANVDPDCADDGPAHKFLFISNRKTDNPTPSDHGRWALMWPGGGGSIQVEAPSDISGSVCGGIPSQICLTGVDQSPYIDGQWHRMRVHVRQDAGLYKVSIDGNTIIQETGFTIGDVNKLWNVLLGRNKDEGNPSGIESLWWGEVRVWTSNPGW